MKIVLLHGENTEESYKRYMQIVQTIKKRGWSVVRISPNSENIADKLVNKSLFGEENLYVIKTAEKISPNFLKWINNNHEKFSSQLLLYSEKKLPANIKKLLPNSVKIEEFELPKLIFNFVDSLVPNNSKNALSLFSKLGDEPTELLIALIGKQFRDIYWVLSGGSPNYPDWRMRKIKNHAGKFTKLEVESIINELAQIDLKSKTSDADVNLLLEMFIINNFS